MYGHYPNAGVTQAYFATYNSMIWQFSTRTYSHRISNEKHRPTQQ